MSAAHSHSGSEKLIPTAVEHSGLLKLHLAQPPHIGAAGAEDVADIRAAGQIAHPELQKPGLEFEVFPNPADPHPFAVRPRRSVAVAS